MASMATLSCLTLTFFAFIMTVLVSAWPQESICDGMKVSVVFIFYFPVGLLCLAGYCLVTSMMVKVGFQVAAYDFPPTGNFWDSYIFTFTFG
jgi:hypothetical protein